MTGSFEIVNLLVHSNMLFFNKKPKVKYLAYMGKKGKYKNILEKFQKDQGSKHALLLYFFDQTRLEMEQLLSAYSIEHNRITADSLLSEGFSFLNVRTLKGKSMPKADAIYCLEVHPLHSINQLPVEAAKDLGKVEITYFAALDEAGMIAFGSEKIVELMKRMGIKEDEELNHAMITNSILKGQKKNEANLPNHVDVQTSQEEWIEKNRAY
jgi:hypothetical protein